MKSRSDKTISRQVDEPAPSRAGGKVLLRLFAYLAERSPALSNDVVETLVIPEATVPRFGFAKGMTQATAASVLAGAPGKRSAAPAARSFGMAISKAATSLALAPTVAATAAGGVAPPAAAIAPMWQSIGPDHIPDGQTYGSNRVDVIGRVSSIAIDPGDPKHILVGSAGGGIWESMDSGQNWHPRTDHMPSLAIGAVAFDPTNPKQVYAGSGEGNFYANLGAGIYGSIDGGTTWTVLASAQFVGVGFYDLVIDPQNSSVLYAATTNGFYKSTNRGSTWSRKRAQKCWDISVHRNGGAIELLAAFDDGLFSSANGGNTFAAVPLPSAPAGPWTRLAVDAVAVAPGVAYAFGAAAEKPHLWRRGAAGWKKIRIPASLDVNQAWYDWYVAATPDREDQVYIGAIETLRGELSGSNWTWTNIITQGSNSIHPDQHCLTFAPGNSKTIYAGNDGGIYRSTNSGRTWKEINRGLAITEIEYMAGDPGTANWLMAGTQDNGTISFTGTSKWNHIADGDGGDCGVNHQNPNTIYHSFYNVSLERSNDKGKTWRRLSPPNPASLFYPPVEVAGLTIGIGASSLVISRDGGASWSIVSLGLSAREMSSAMRAIDANSLLVGTNMGRMLKMSWTGTAWSKTALGSPAAKYISCIAIDPSNPQRFWLTISQVTGAGVQVYRSDNGGTSWVSCSAGLPKIPFNSVVVDPANFQRVWVAADVGVYMTLDLGASWTAFSTGLPNAMAVDLLFHKQDRKLICGTRNRGAWLIDIP